MTSYSHFPDFFFSHFLFSTRQYHKTTVKSSFYNSYCCCCFYNFLVIHFVYTYPHSSISYSSSYYHSFSCSESARFCSHVQFHCMLSFSNAQAIQFNLFMLNFMVHHLFLASPNLSKSS